VNNKHAVPPQEKNTICLYFQVIHPEAISREYAENRNQEENVEKVIKDILGPGNEKCILPGQPEASWMKRTLKSGLLFTEAEMKSLSQIAIESRIQFDLLKFAKLNHQTVFNS